MSKLLSVLAREFTLMVSLPKNSPEMAVAAVKAGAKCIKVHLNCHHHASGTTFGSWEQERSAITEILSAVNIPVGMVTGETVQPSTEELHLVQEAGIDFWDLFAKFTPPGHFRLPMGRMVAVDSSWTPHLIQDFEKLGVQIIEGSIVPKTEYGTPLNLVDLSNYSQLCKASSLPVLIPTQKAIRPDEVSFLRKSGAAGITIGAIVTGIELDTLRAATERFAESIASMSVASVP